MEQRTTGRVVGIIHAQRIQHAAPARPMAHLPRQPLRLVARPDKQMARLVENGLAIYALRGHIDAISYFAAAGISLRTISRVLWQPGQRRSHPF
ncbi:hypothetical protein [Rugamonas aquatica]|uniref:Uncharacterized protein n=1 Tax=Rugamonas aquatica TaxID=2743357 RepID=A0A6A7MUG4_9BURK|nr:hypothetical protein [Rugamonas aquatica]MQA36573.1 hypothetical protein [Rugamonas aquatica]